MNFLALGARTLKAAEKARGDAAYRKLETEFAGIPYTGPDPDELYNETIDREFDRMTRAFDIGLTYFEMAKQKLGKNTSNRWYMLTIRPPSGKVALTTFTADVHKHVQKWKNHWVSYEYVFEQKGETLETMGTGFHTHIIIETNRPNYYPSHIKKSAATDFPYTNQRAIDVATLKNVVRAKEYIRGCKQAIEKEPAVVMDKPWRAANKLSDLYNGLTEIEPGQGATLNSRLLTFV